VERLRRWVRHASSHHNNSRGRRLNAPSSSSVVLSICDKAERRSERWTDAPLACGWPKLSLLGLLGWASDWPSTNPDNLGWSPPAAGLSALECRPTNYLWTGQRVVARVDSRGGRANARSTGAGKRLRRSGLDRNYSDGVLTTGPASAYHKNSADCVGQSDAADRSLDQLCTVARFEHLYAPADFVYAHRSAL